MWISLTQAYLSVNFWYDFKDVIYINLSIERSWPKYTCVVVNTKWRYLYIFYTIFLTRKVDFPYFFCEWNDLKKYFCKLVTYRVAETWVSEIGKCRGYWNGFNQGVQCWFNRFSSFYCQIFGIFDDFSRRISPKTYSETLKNHQIFQITLF